MKRKLDENTTWATEDGVDYIQETLNVDSILEANKEALKSDSKYIRPKEREMVKVADIDMVTYTRLMKEGILDDEKAFRRWLNDPDNRYFRTNNMKL